MPKADGFDWQHVLMAIIKRIPRSKAIFGGTNLLHHRVIKQLFRSYKNHHQQQ
jgi:hypothetical protein